MVVVVCSQRSRWFSNGHHLIKFCPCAPSLSVHCAETAQPSHARGERRSSEASVPPHVSRRNRELHPAAHCTPTPKMLRFIATRTGRVRALNVAPRPTARLPEHRAWRSLQTSARAGASVEDNPSNFMQKLMDSPEAMKSITKLMDLLEQKGVDVKSGSPPSMLQMAKIAADGQIRSATGDGKHLMAVRKVAFPSRSLPASVAPARPVMTALREAGIDVSPERMQELLGAKGNFFDKAGGGGGDGGEGEKK